MQRLDKRGIVGGVLLVVGVMALIGGFDSRVSWAADPDRHVSEPDRHFDSFDSAELEALLEEALGGLAEQIGQAMEQGAIRVDDDWPDTIWLRDGSRSLRFDTDRFARKMERMAREIERSVTRVTERELSRSGRRVRVSRDRDDARMDREDIEMEMRELQREMRRLERQLEKLGAEGDI